MNFQLTRFTTCSVIWAVYILVIIFTNTSVAHSYQESGNNGESSINQRNIEGGGIFLNPYEPELETQTKEMYNYLTDKMGTRVLGSSGSVTKKPTFAGADLSIFNPIFTGGEGNVSSDTFCPACRVYIGVLMYKINRQRESRENVEQFVIFTCLLYQLVHPEVCRGIVRNLGPTFYWIVRARGRELSPREFCGVTFQSIGCRTSHRRNFNSEFDWEVDPIPFTAQRNSHGTESGEKYFTKPNLIENVTPASTSRGDKPPMKILHLTDLHIDPRYAAGTNADCLNKILCCQKQFGYPEIGEVGAGYYGDNRRCDAPMKMLHSALIHIKEEHTDIDMIYMTGDLVPHNIWSTNKEENVKITRQVSRILYAYFPSTRIIPCLGNHEAHPANLYSPSSRTFKPSKENPIPRNLRQDWVYASAYAAWKQWIPTEQRENFLRAGSYVIEVTNKLRALVINTNVCYAHNMWQTYAPKDPSGILHWMQKELHVTAKQNNIIGHVPPGHEDCAKTWSREFYKIVVRYKNIITGQFYGHTHYDEFRILHDPKKKSEAIGVMWIAPSLSPYRSFNPGYRVYHMDANDQSYGNIVDHETWIYDLNKANRNYRERYGENNGTIQPTREEDESFGHWFKSYQATKAYNIPNVLPITLEGLVLRMAKDRETFDIFYRNYYKATDLNFRERNGDDTDTVSRKRILCGIMRNYYDDDGQQMCNQIQKAVDKIILPLSALEQQRRYIWL